MNVSHYLPEHIPLPSYISNVLLGLFIKMIPCWFVQFCLKMKKQLSVYQLVDGYFLLPITPLTEKKSIKLILFYVSSKNEGLLDLVITVAMNSYQCYSCLPKLFQQTNFCYFCCRYVWKIRDLEFINYLIRLHKWGEFLPQ